MVEYDELLTITSTVEILLAVSRRDFCVVNIKVSTGENFFGRSKVSVLGKGPPAAEAGVLGDSFERLEL